MDEIVQEIMKSFPEDTQENLITNLRQFDFTEFLVTVPSLQDKNIRFEYLKSKMISGVMSDQVKELFNGVNTAEGFYNKFREDQFVFEGPYSIENLEKELERYQGVSMNTIKCHQ